MSQVSNTVNMSNLLVNTVFFYEDVMISAFERAKVCYAHIAIRFPKTILEFFSAGPSYSNCKIGLKVEVELS